MQKFYSGEPVFESAPAYAGATCPSRGLEIKAKQQGEKLVFVPLAGYDLYDAQCYCWAFYSVADGGYWYDE